ncbi:MAG: tRNA nucleotidyltransferase, partial [Candidatus Cloacimonadota bacterium]
MENVLKKIADAIVGTEFENKTFAVGGYVRDLLMKRQTEDLDIVVNLKNGGIKLAKFLFEKGISSKPIVYENFGTAMVKIAGYQIEFVMTRRESYRDKNRKPEVEFGTLEEDVFRRDFTINSLLLNISANEILDLTGKGKSDIQNGIIRSTSDPKIIFGEDPLRMLRAVRFAVQLDFEIEKETQKGIIENASKLQFISAERK